MAATLALGQTPTSQESAGLGEEAMLPRPGPARVDVCEQDETADTGWPTDLETPRVCGRNQNPAPHKNPASRQPVRPTMEDLLRGTCVPKEVRSPSPGSPD